MSKHIIFDAGPLINFAMNNMLEELKRLKEIFPGDFLITKEVKYEIIDRPLNIRKFKYEALQLQDMFKKGIIRHADITNEQVDELRRIREQIMSIANSTYCTKEKNIHILDKGECAALALSMIINEPNIIAVDERTTRMICENPENLRKLLEKKLHTRVSANKENYDFFKRFKIVRSIELAYIAYKKGLYDIKSPDTLDAILWALKLHGCSVSESEINEIKRM